MASRPCTTARKTYKQIGFLKSRNQPCAIRHDAVPVCEVAYDAMTPLATDTFPLAIANDGSFRWVNHVDDKYVVSYFNQELRRSIPLGTYTDARTAALAHSIVRHKDDARLRSEPYAVMHVIQDMMNDSILATSDIALPAAFLETSADERAVDTNDDEFFIENFYDLFDDGRTA